MMGISRHESFHLQPLDGTKMSGAGGEERVVILEGGSADQGIGQSHAV
jgi:hypothetical protein